jgi:hypothetical protein
MKVALGATLSLMATSSANPVRAFWFAKAARKAHITDDELCSAVSQVAIGQADDLGGGVYKKRLKKTIPFDHSREGWNILGLRVSIRQARSGEH